MHACRPGGCVLYIFKHATFATCSYWSKMDNHNGCVGHSGELIYDTTYDDYAVFMHV